MAISESHQRVHERALKQYQEGQFVEAAPLLSEEIVEQPSGEVWNDWAAVQTSMGQIEDAERRFRRGPRIKLMKGFFEKSLQGGTQNWGKSSVRARLRYL